MSQVSLVEAVSAADLDRARALFLEYAGQLEVDLCLQGFAAELQALGTLYGAPSGRLILARDGGSDVGCVGVRAFDAGRCEMKRLYVRRNARGRGHGRKLALAAIAAAADLGYAILLLDTLDSMAAARALYRKLGFKPIDHHGATAPPGAICMALDLNAHRGRDASA